MILTGLLGVHGIGQLLDTEDRVATDRVESTLEFTECSWLRDKGADHLGDPLWVTLAVESVETRSEADTKSCNPVSAPESGCQRTRVEDGHGGWFVRVVSWAEFTVGLTPPYHGADERLRREGRGIAWGRGRGKGEEQRGLQPRGRGVLERSTRLLGGRARTYRTSCTYRPALSTT